MIDPKPGHTIDPDDMSVPSDAADPITDPVSPPESEEEAARLGDFA